MTKQLLRLAGRTDNFEESAPDWYIGFADHRASLCVAEHSLVTTAWWRVQGWGLEPRFARSRGSLTEVANQRYELVVFSEPCEEAGQGLLTVVGVISAVFRDGDDIVIGDVDDARLPGSDRGVELDVILNTSDGRLHEALLTVVGKPYRFAIGTS